jgi:hypothetical protein
MIQIRFKFCTMYEGGEETPPQFELEEEVTLDAVSTPRFKDQIKRGDYTYLVWDVVYELSGAAMRPFIKAVRRVTHPPKDGSRR